MSAFDRVAALAVLVALAGCTQRMAEHGRVRPDGASAFFSDGAARRQAPAHTVAQDAPEFAAPKPALTRALLERGRERYGISCAPCHGLAGDGRGVIPAHGFPAPPSYHDKRLREAPDEHLYDVITHGWGVMYPYANRVAPADRWAIAAYVRALQLSQNADAFGPVAPGGPR